MADLALKPESRIIHQSNGVTVHSEPSLGLAARL